MRSFFKKPDWAKTDSTPGQSTEFYRRSEQVYTDIISRKLDEGSEDDEKNEEASNHLQDDRLQEPQSSLESRGSKRPRVSREESVPSTKCPCRDSEGCEKRKEDQADVKEKLYSVQRMQQAPAVTMSHTQVKNPPTKVNNELPPPATVVELDSDSDTGSLRPKSQGVQATQPHSKQAPKHDLDDEEDDDDDLYAEEEYAELARKARERARLQRAASAGNTGPDPATAGARTTQSPNIINHATKSTSNTPDRQSQPVEPIVRILITSDLPNTNPLIVQRRLNQDLRDVRRAWCSRQGFDDNLMASVFLTWKGRRLFDVTTCKSLGVLEDKERGLLQPLPIRDYYNDSDDDGRDSDLLEVHMEAVTEKLFEERKRQAMKASQGESGGSGEDEADDDNDDEEGNETGRETQEKQNVFLIILKCPGVEDLKIRVRHKTHISSIIRSFREKRDIPSHRTVQLLFDGDQLHPDSMVSDNDMADLDAIDVRIK
ncbi:hypothetical protein ACJ73_03418 [Blastomyces percursus]|uniref:Rad60/SUMO-like domain-containing protein n=1 Tax=Blastomyces percursus TaxID=1658174 RepID=A0A1J9QAY1_9EURO|nr:hypothetical protein ACJ73_03418 [Blastomyces percursus]